MLKILGIILVMAASSSIGAVLSSNLSRRVSDLEQAIRLLEQMQTYLRYGQMPTAEMVSRLSGSEGFAGFTFLSVCLERMKAGDLFPDAWRAALRSFHGSKLSDRDKGVLETIADILGGSDYESQLHALELNITLLGQNLKEALAEKNTGGKLYRSLGVLLGIGAAIFML